MLSAKRVGVRVVEWWQSVAVSGYARGTRMMYVQGECDFL